MILKNSIIKLMQKQNVDTLSCQEIIHNIISGEADPLQTAAFLVLLRAKTETPEELAGIISAVKQKMIPVVTSHKVLDIVGTGGDGANTINISTGSAILAASCGIKIAKHGNRAVSSLAGSADVLEALNININLSPEKISACIDQVGIGFCFSPNFYPAMQALRTLRKQLNVPTTFNIIGPLLNPANPRHILLGVFDEALLETLAQTLQKMGTERSMIVHGCGLDEISCVGPAQIIEITQNTIKKSILDPQKLGFSLCQKTDLQGGNADMNAKILVDVFSNTHQHSAIANTLMLNTGVALYLYGHHVSILDGIAQAKEKLYDGSVLTLLKKWSEFSHDQ